MFARTHRENRNTEEENCLIRSILISMLHTGEENKTVKKKKKRSFPRITFRNNDNNDHLPNTCLV